MKYRIDHDYHIHTFLSSCSRDPLQNAQRLLQYAKENDLSSICVTDHYWDSAVEGASSWYAPQNFDHISEIKPLPQADGINFFFGCESDMDKHLHIGLPKSRFADFDFVIIPTTHMHMVGFTVPEEAKTDLARKASLWVSRLDALFAMDLPFEKIGIAHLACGLIHKYDRGEFLSVLDRILETELERVFSKAAVLGCGIELNQSDMTFADAEADTVLRIFRVAKSCGCKFYLGSDAHHPADFADTKAVFTRAVDLLELTENDKFYIR